MRGAVLCRRRGIESNLAQVIKEGFDTTPGWQYIYVYLVHRRAHYRGERGLYVHILLYDVHSQADG